MTTTLEELSRRVTAPEAAQNDTVVTLKWTVSQLAQIKAMQDEHTLRLDQLQRDMTLLRAEGTQTRAELRSLRDELPTIVGDVVRAVFAARDTRK